jgi:ammonia channel protein AmtB
MSNELCNFIGTLMMWFSLCHLYSGYSLTVYRQRYQVELAYVNCLLAGGAGGISAFLLKSLIDTKYFRKQTQQSSTTITSNFDFSV